MAEDLKQVDIVFHDPPELTQLLVQTISLPGPRSVTHGPSSMEEGFSRSAHLDCSAETESHDFDLSQLYSSSPGVKIFLPRLLLEEDDGRVDS